MNVERCIDKIDKIDSMCQELHCVGTNVDDSNMIRIDRNLGDEISYMLKEYKYYLLVQNVPTTK